MTKVAWWVAVVPLFLIPFVALFVPENLFFPFITGKNFLFRILVEISFAGWLVLAFADKAHRPKFSWTLLLYGGLVAWMFFANLMAVNPHKAFWSNFERMDGFVTLVHVFMFFLVAGSLLAKETLRQNWWRAFIASAGLACAVALLQVSGMLTINQGGLRVDSTFGNAIYFAVFLMFALGATIWQACVTKGVLRYVLILLAIAEFAFLVLTASRGAIIATLGALLFAGTWAVWRAGPTGRKIALTAFVALFVLIGGFFLARNTAVVQETPLAARLATVFSVGSELGIRFSVWNMALLGAAERPLTGWGQEGFHYVFLKHYDPSLYRAEPYYDRAHNTYLDWLIAGGVPAFLLFVALLGTAALSVLRSSLSRGERLMLLSLLVGYGIQALVVFDNLFSYIPLAIVLATAHIASSRPIRTLEDLPAFPEQGLGVVVAPAVTALTVATLWIVNVPNMAAAEDIIRAQQPTSTGVQGNYALFEETLASGTYATQEVREQLALFSVRMVAEPSLDNETKGRFLTLALTEMDKELKRAPGDVRLWLQRAAIYRAGGDFENALRSIDTAIALSPNRQTSHLERGGMLWLMGRKEEGRESFRTAYELDPSFNEPLIYLAASEIVGGDVPAAHAILLAEFGTTTVDHDALWNAYALASQYEQLLVLQRMRVENTGGDPSQRFLLARVLVAAGRVEEARMEIGATIAAHPEVAPEGQALLSQIPVSQ